MDPTIKFFYGVDRDHAPPRPASTRASVPAIVVLPDPPLPPTAIFVPDPPRRRVGPVSVAAP
jgi:hypothetical protein